MTKRDDYWMVLARSALKAILRHDSALYGSGAGTDPEEQYNLRVMAQAHLVSLVFEVEEMTSSKR